MFVLNICWTRYFIFSCELHYTSERLFGNWQSNDYTILSEEESAKYLPSLSESCKLRILDEQWDTYKRFEACKKKGKHTMLNEILLHLYKNFQSN